MPPPPSSVPSAASGGRRGLLWAVLVALVVLTLIVGGVALTLALRGGAAPGTAPSGGSGGGSGLAAVADEPAEVWSWRSDGRPIRYLSASEDRVLVAFDDEQGIVVLDADGEELWSDDSKPWFSAYFRNDGDHVVATYRPDDGNYRDVVFDRDGEQLWQSSDDDSFWGTLEDGDYLIRNHEEFRKVDPETDDVAWRIKGETAARGEEQLIVVRGNTVAAHDLDTGEERWSTDLPDGHAGGAEEAYPSLWSNDEFLLVETGSLTALSRDGDVLWTESGSGVLGRMVGDRFILVPDYDVEDRSGPYPIYGIDGRVGELDPQPEDADLEYFYLYPVDVDGVEMNFDETNGVLYDADGAVVQTGYEDAYQPVEGGFYTLHEATFGYQRWGEEEPVWTVAVAGAESVADVFDDESADILFRSIDGALYVADAGTVWRYE